MKLKLLDKKDYPLFEKFVLSNENGSIFQSLAWAKFKLSSKSREQKYWIIAEKDSHGKISGGALVYKMHLFKSFSFFYCPRGPLNLDPKDLVSVLKPLAKKEKAIFFRMDPFQEKEIEGFNKSHSSQPENTLFLDLTMPLDEILKQMAPKGRYNIKVAQKHGVEISTDQDPDSIKKFHNLLTETFTRDGFNGHPISYYQTMLDTLVPLNMAKLYLASYKGEVIAGLLATFYRDTAIYYYGASSSKHRNTMAPYLLQWTAIQEAKERGLAHYDFLGISPQNAKNHPWAGVTDFKLKFGGTRKNYPSAQDYPFSRLMYLLFRIYKKYF